MQVTYAKVCIGSCFEFYISVRQVRSQATTHYFPLGHACPIVKICMEIYWILLCYVTLTITNSQWSFLSTTSCIYCNREEKPCNEYY